DQTRARVAGGGEVSRSRGGAGTPRGGIWSSRARCTSRVDGKVRPLCRRVSPTRRPARSHATPPAAGRLGRRPSHVSAGRKGAGGARLVGKGTQRGRQTGALVDRWRRRSDALDQDAAHVRRGRRL